MSSNRIDRSRSLESGVTPRRLNQVVLREPGNPIASTTSPCGGRVVLPAWTGLCCSGAPGGGLDGDSGWTSVSILLSWAGWATGAAAFWASESPSSYVGTMGSGWCASTGGFCWPTFPVASAVFSCFFLRRFMRSRIQLRIDRVYHTAIVACNLACNLAWVCVADQFD